MTIRRFWLVGIAAACCGLFNISVALAHDLRQSLIASRHTMMGQFAAVEASDLDEDEKSAIRGAIQRDAHWSKSILTVCFGANDRLVKHQGTIHAIMRVAQEWTEGTNLSFVYLDVGRIAECDQNRPADIRVKVGRREGMAQRIASQIGTLSRHSLNLDPDFADLAGYSMVLEFRDDDGCRMGPATCVEPDDLSFRYLVLHEFGHALGFLHEHQRIQCKLKAQVVKDEWLHDWEIKQIEDNLGFLEKYEAQDVPDVIEDRRRNMFQSSFDKNSVMNYNDLMPKFFEKPERCMSDRPRSEVSPMDHLVARFVYNGNHLRGGDASSAQPLSRAACAVLKRVRAFAGVAAPPNRQCTDNR